MNPALLNKCTSNFGVAPCAAFAHASDAAFIAYAHSQRNPKLALALQVRRTITDPGYNCLVWPGAREPYDNFSNTTRSGHELLLDLEQEATHGEGFVRCRHTPTRAYCHKFDSNGTGVADNGETTRPRN